MAIVWLEGNIRRKIGEELLIGFIYTQGNWLSTSPRWWATGITLLVMKPGTAETWDEPRDTQVHGLAMTPEGPKNMAFHSWEMRWTSSYIATERSVQNPGLLPDNWDNSGPVTVDPITLCIFMSQTVSRSWTVMFISGIAQTQEQWCQQNSNTTLQYISIQIFYIYNNKIMYSRSPERLKNYEKYD